MDIETINELQAKANETNDAQLKALLESAIQQANDDNKDIKTAWEHYTHLVQPLIDHLVMIDGYIDNLPGYMEDTDEGIDKTGPYMISFIQNRETMLTELEQHIAGIANALGVDCKDKGKEVVVKNISDQIDILLNKQKLPGLI